ncbi:MAG: cytochrome c oxidase subunit II [Bacteroidetes bacterium QS_8_68_15]|jgi:cytochrome c oxidase subunit 2|nr:MAG: cytochrome c oxidase subunit II [Bacteroidetes bacterium QS_8_68_15]
MDDATVWLPEQASTLAPEIDALFYFVYWTSIVLFVGVMGAMLYFAYKYRRQHPSERPAPVKENKLIEISWIVIPTILVLVVFTWGFQSFIKIGTAPPNAYEINVQGEQWNWNFTYPNGTSITNELHVPAGRPVRLKMSSTDVLHSFFVPAFRVKHDVLPDRYSYLWFEATETGTYKAFCTEYCGTQHSAMDAKVVVHDQQDFQEWLQTGGGVADLPPAEYGKVLYERQGCNACHSLDGSSNVGPTWQGLYGTTGHEMSSGQTVTVDENYLRESIVAPYEKIVAGYGSNMPSNYGSLSERQLTSLIEFMKTQSDKTLTESSSGSSGVGAAE